MFSPNFYRQFLLVNMQMLSSYSYNFTNFLYSVIAFLGIVEK